MTLTDESRREAGPSGPLVLVTIPARNEEVRLRDSVTALKEVLQSSGLRYILSIAEDGSTDRTKKVIAELLKDDPAVVAICDEISRGRGFALRRLWSGFAADVYVFVDADLAMGPEAVKSTVELVLSNTDVVTGSRYCPGSAVVRPPFRDFVSRWYNWLVRLWFDERICDHQCGLKGFSSFAVQTLLPYTSESSWFWDTEILVLATAAGFEVKEVPVTWTERKTSRTQIRRLLSDLYLHGTGLIRLLSEVDGSSKSLKRPRPFRPRADTRPHPQPLDNSTAL